MKEFVDKFKIDLEELYNGWYQGLEELVHDTMYNMSFFSNDDEGNYELLQKAMIEMVQQKMMVFLDEDEEA